jgi:hypothetical protein
MVSCPFVQWTTDHVYPLAHHSSSFGRAAPNVLPFPDRTTTTYSFLANDESLLTSPQEAADTVGI